MLTTLAIISSHIIVALLARKRKMGFTKALVMSFFLTPLLTPIYRIILAQVKKEGGLASDV